MIKDDTLTAFAFNIYLPNESSPKFFIFHDLAELFGDETNRDALMSLRRMLRDHPENPRGKLKTDCESDRVSLRASKADVIFLTARIINENSIPSSRRHFSEEEYSDILSSLSAWKRRKPQKWDVGNIFSIPLGDGECVFGQVLAGDYGAPTCALLNIKTCDDAVLADIEQARVISILHVGSDLLDKGVWKVLGSTRLLADPDASPQGKRFEIGTKSCGSGKALRDLAEAYFGLPPWNVGYCGDDDYFDKQLMPDVERPDNCLWLGASERQAYRELHGITA